MFSKLLSEDLGSSSCGEIVVVVSAVVVVSWLSSGVTVFTAMSPSVAGPVSDLTVLPELLFIASYLSFLLLFGFSRIL